MSFNHQAYNSEALHNPQTALQRLLATKRQYGVEVIEADVAEGETYWKLISLHHLNPPENRSKHNIYLEVLDEAGQRIQGGPVLVTWDWEGGPGSEQLGPIRLDKPANEPAGDIPMESGQKIVLRIQGLDPNRRDKSDTVKNLHAGHPDEPDPSGQKWNTIGHHSFYLIFQRTRKGAPGQEVDAAPPEEVTTPSGPEAGGESNGQSAPQPAPAQPTPGFYPQFIYGMHEEGGAEDLMAEAGRPGWILEMASVGLDPNAVQGRDFTHLTNRGLRVIMRLHNGFGSAGTLPHPDRYPDFARACAAFAARSKGCHIWIISNEPNHEVERPDGQFIIPWQYAEAYRLCRNAIHQVRDHERDQVLVAGPALWNNTTIYEENPSGDWVKYFGDTLALLGEGECDGFALHTYTHLHDPTKIKADIQFDHPDFRHLRNEFRTYRDFMAAIPARFRHLPVYITETDPTERHHGWENGENNGWVRTAYEEIAAWNSDARNQPILALILYRWTEAADQPEWSIRNRPGVIEDFKQAMRAEPADAYRIRLPATAPIEPPIKPDIDDKVKPPSRFTNQHIIAAFARAAQQLKLGNWDLMNLAGLKLADLAVPKEKRDQLYTGTSIDQLPNLTDLQRNLVKHHLAAQIGLEAADLSFSFGARGTEEVPASAGFLRMQADLAEVPLAPEASLQISSSGANNNLELRVISAWNRYGWLLITLADTLGIEPEVAVAVLTNEVTRRGFDSEGRMLIRFESQIFFDKWGQANADKFNPHFRFDPDRPWQSHQWRPTPDAAWRKIHEGHNSEWQAFTLAQSLDDTAAKLAIAMGAPQIMGFNYPVIGHLSVDQMFADFSTSEQHQIIGFFDLIGGLTADSRQLDALRRQDFDSFAALQYGGQQAARQANNLRRLLAAFQALQPK